MEHAVDNDIVGVLGLARDPGQSVGASCVLPHVDEVRGLLGGRVIRDRKLKVFAFQKVGVGDSLVCITGLENVALAGCQAGLVNQPSLGSESDERAPSRCGSAA